MARRVAEVIEKKMLDGDVDGDELETLMRVQQAESRMITKLMTALRITPQSVVAPEISPKKGRRVVSPWDAFGS